MYFSRAKREEKQQSAHSSRRVGQCSPDYTSSRHRYFTITVTLDFLVRVDALSVLFRLVNVKQAKQQQVRDGRSSQQSFRIVKLCRAFQRHARKQRMPPSHEMSRLFRPPVSVFRISSPDGQDQVAHNQKAFPFSIFVRLSSATPLSASTAPQVRACLAFVDRHADFRVPVRS